MTQIQIALDFQERFTMGRRTTFVDIANMAAARRCYEAGQSIAQIAASAQKSKSTIVRWIKMTGVPYPKQGGRKS